MKWFKHYTDASRSEKLESLIDKTGLEGYARYFLLVELLAEKFDGKNTTFRINKRTLSRQLRYYRHTMAEQWLNNGQTLGLYNFQCDGDVYVIVFPKLLEIKDNHTRNLQVTSKKVAPRKDKEKKRIDKTREEGITPDDVVQLWNEFATKNNLKICRGLGSGKHLQNFIEAINWLKEKKDWDELFTLCGKSDFLMGKENGDWIVSLTWLVDYDNALKVLNGNFEKKEFEIKLSKDVQW